jgi:hypothetical protein
MIYSYAIDPIAVAEWAKHPLVCRMIDDHFGLGRPKVVAEFPKLKKWRKQLKEASFCLGDIELQRLTALFLRLTEVQAQRQGKNYDSNISWIENAVREHRDFPFHAIVSQKTGLPYSEIPILFHDRLADWPIDKWNLENNTTVHRTAEDMGTAVAPLLKNSHEIIFIDPYYRANKEKWLKPLQVFFSYCNFSRDDIRVEIHAAVYENSPSTIQFEQEFRERLPSRLPSTRFAVKIKRWKQRCEGEKLHNRYILTDIGGITFSTGLDSGSAGETDDISLLNREQYLKRWNQYCGENPAFDLDLSFEINS